MWRHASPNTKPGESIKTQKRQHMQEIVQHPVERKIFATGGFA